MWRDLYSKVGPPFNRLFVTFDPAIKRIPLPVLNTFKLFPFQDEKVQTGLNIWVSSFDTP